MTAPDPTLLPPPPRRVYANRTLNMRAIRAIGYDSKSQTLEVEFNDGKVMSYSGVSPEVHRRFMAAPSPVSFYEDKIEEDFRGRRI